MIIILDAENVERIQAYDPCELAFSNFPEAFRNLPMNHISICFATPAEMERIDQLARKDKLAEILRIVGRGFRIEQSDLKRGAPYEIIERDGDDPS